MTIPINKTDLRREDVLCGSGKALMHHPGNQKFRIMVKARVDQYFDSDRYIKTRISEEIVRDMEALGGRFLKQNKSDGAWHVIGHAEAIDKTSQALRDMKRRMLRELQQETSTTTTAASAASTTAISPETSKSMHPFVSQPARDQVMSSTSCESKQDKLSRRGSSDDNSMIVHTNDVVCGSGRAVMELPGNKAFRALVKANVDRFVDGDRGISTFIVQEVMNNGGRFLKRNTEGSWCTLGHEEAVLKTSQALRDARRILLREREHGQSDNNNNINIIKNYRGDTCHSDPTITTSSKTTTSSTTDPFSEQDRETLEVANSLYQLSMGTFELSGTAGSTSINDFISRSST